MQHQPPLSSLYQQLILDHNRSPRNRGRLEDASRHGTFLNGERVEGEMRLGAGDRLRVGAPGVEVQLIVVDDG